LKRILVVLLVIGTALPADAQVRRRVPRVPEPSLWGGLSVGLLNANDVSDGETESTWDFGRASTPQYRGSLEMAVGRNASVGASATYAHVPFIYRSNLVLPGGEDCSRCDAHLDVISLGASFHYGGGSGLHQVMEASAGALQFRNLKRDGGGRLAPVSGNIDPYFTFGYGFGYSFAPSMQVSVVQDFGLALHESKSLTSDQSNTLRQRTIRLNFRYGFGNRVRGKQP
jgi:hypothetical protein